MAQLINEGWLTALYDGMELEAESHVTVEMPAVTLIKKADQDTWIGDELMYTIIAHNVENVDTGKPATTVVFTDTINPKLATLVDDSMTIGGVPMPKADYDFVLSTGELTVRLPDIDPDVVLTITFRVKKV